MKITGFREHMLYTSRGLTFESLAELAHAVFRLGEILKEDAAKVRGVVTELVQTMQSDTTIGSNAVAMTPYFEYDARRDSRAAFSSLVIEAKCIVKRKEVVGYTLHIHSPLSPGAVNHVEVQLATALGLPRKAYGVEMYWHVERKIVGPSTFDVPRLVGALLAISDMHLKEWDLNLIERRRLRGVAEQFEGECRGYKIEWGMFGEFRAGTPWLMITILRGRGSEDGMLAVAEDVKRAIASIR